MVCVRVCAGLLKCLPCQQAIYINDFKDATGRELIICKPMLEFAAASLPECVFVGVLGIAGEGHGAKVRPCWVWRKGSGATAPIYSVVARATSAVPGTAILCPGFCFCKGVAL